MTSLFELQSYNSKQFLDVHNYCGDIFQDRQSYNGVYCGDIFQDRQSYNRVYCGDIFQDRQSYNGLQEETGY